MRAAGRVLFICASSAAVLAAVVAPTGAGADAPLAYRLPHTPPSWAPEGSWVKHSSPTVGDVDPSRGNGVESAVASLDGWLYVLRVSGGQLQRVWSANLDTWVNSSPVIADLDGDGFREVLIGAGDSQRRVASGVHVFAHDGRKIAYWATPEYPDYANGVISSPVVGDVTGDGHPEVVYGAFNHHIYVKDRNGVDVPGWQGGKFVYDTVWSSPSLADVDGNGDLEIVIGSDLGGGLGVFGCPQPTRGMVSIFDGSGSFLPGWPKCMDTPIWSSPAVMDVTGDGILDVIVATNNYIENGVNVGAPWKVYAYSADGRSLWSASLAAGGRIHSSPAVGDVTGDGRPEVAVGTIEGAVGSVYLLDAVSGRILWSRDDGGAGDCCIFMGSPVFADVSGDGVADVVAAGGDGAIYAWNGSGESIFRTVLGRTFFNSPAVADVNGDGRNDVVSASAGTPADPDCSYKCGKVFVAGTAGTGVGPWPMFRRDAARLGTVGSGRLPGAGSPSAPAPPAPVKKKATQPKASTAPTNTLPPTEAPTAEPDEPRRVAVKPLDDDTGSSAARWAALAAAVASLAGVAAAIFVLRRRRQLS